MSKPLAQELFEEITAEKQWAAMDVFSRLAEPCIEQMKASGLVVEDTDENGNAIIRGTTKLATEQAYAASCEATGIEYEPTWVRND